MSKAFPNITGIFTNFYTRVAVQGIRMRGIPGPGRIVDVKRRRFQIKNIVLYCPRLFSVTKETVLFFVTVMSESDIVRIAIYHVLFQY